MRSLHTVEEQIYGPKSKLDNKSKVFLCVRHNTLRWDVEACEINYKFLIEKTGLNERRVIECIAQLEKDNLIVVMRRKKGKQHLPNIIGLDPNFFGELLEKKHAPSLRILHGGKNDACANPQKGVLQESAEGVLRQSADRNPWKPAPIAEFAEPKELRERTNLKKQKNQEELNAQEFGNGDYFIDENETRRLVGMALKRMSI